MGRTSRDKGKRGERELARELTRLFGVKARRGQQYCGGPDSPDVLVDIPNIHIECKRAERFRLYDAIDQAIGDAGVGQVPIVMHRSNLNPWVAVVLLDDLPKLASLIHEAMKNLEKEED
jgi:Holliday junction resolvase